MDGLEFTNVIIGNDPVPVRSEWERRLNLWRMELEQRYGAENLW